MIGARILILEDDPQWLRTLHDVLDPVADQVAHAITLSQACDLVVRRYFNVAVVDLSLRLGDPKDSQGMAFLQQLRDLGLEEAVHCVILSVYGNVERVREAFRDFQVVDFLEKAPFQADELRAAVSRALANNHLNRAVEIEVDNGERLGALLTPFNWARREDPLELEPEFHDLLLRLFPEADHLIIQKLPAGQSGAGVLKVDSYYGARAGNPVIVKFGKRDKIRHEQRNYSQFIGPFVGAYSSTQLRFASGRAMGAICYQLIGTEWDEVVSFSSYYDQHDVAEVCKALDILFRDTCGRWYDNREMPRQTRNIVGLYERGLNIAWDEVWDGAAATGVEINTEAIEFPGLAGAFVNPKRWLEERDYSIYLPAWRAITHGDLNEHNVLVTEDGRCWLIDFYRTGLGHILRDVVELETAIKFNLTPIGSLAEHQQLEEHLLRQTRINQPVVPPASYPHSKPLAAIGHLRNLADALTGRNQDLTEYNVALLLTTLNLLRFQFMRDQHRRLLLSSAMLCQHLSAAGV